jgi:amino acid adenylation domain-containing protein
MTDPNTRPATDFPLTKQQEGLWVEWKLHPDNSSYNTCVNLRLKGRLDEARFDQALHDVVRFFTSLRIVFTEKNGVPRQRIHDEVIFHLEKEDVSSAAHPEETAELAAYGRAFLARKVATPIDLTVFPIVHAGLLKVTHDTYYFIGLVPHIISDGVSAVLFLESTSIAYNQGYAGLVAAYGQNEKSWDDYFAHHAHADAALMKTAAAYWQQRLEGAEHTVNFNPASARASKGKAGKRVYFDVSHAISAQLKQLCRTHRTTFFSVLNATFAALMHRNYGCEDITIGYPVSIRPAGYKTFFGFFVNIIPLRIDSSGNPTFAALLAHIAEGRKADKDYQTFPALDIVRNIRAQDSTFDGRVFNISMAQTVSRLVNLQLDGIVSEPLEVTYNDVNDDLSLSYEILDDGRIGLWCEYRESLFSPDDIARMMADIQRIFAQTIAHPNIRLSDLVLGNPLPAVDDALYAPDMRHRPATLTAWLRDAAIQYGDAPALIDDAAISYAELHAKAHQLAHYLIQQGIHSGDCVAVYLPRGANHIIALLACLSIGAAYVPCSIEYPQARMDSIIAQADCAAIIILSTLPLDVACTRVLLDGDAWTHCPTSAPECVVMPEQLAYIIFTSGSTGTPKGVAINHKNIVARLDWMHDALPLTPNDRTLHNTDITFDVSVAEIFWTLTSGAALVLTDSERYKDAGYLLQRIRDMRVTASCIVPSLLNSILALNAHTPLLSLKYLLSAGEALPPALVTQYYQQCSGTLYNVYGPTEATIYATAYQCIKDQHYDAVPIGYAIKHTDICVINQYEKRVPYGVIGELCIGGAAIAAGYWRDEERSKASFIPHPDDAHKTIYKTGDVASISATGEVTYFGRRDTQVKIRGYRIELGEIASLACQHPDITDATAIDYRPAETTHTRLVLYYCSAHPLEADSIKTHLEQHLPSYMIPHHYMHVEAIPRMSSSKINRRALPAPDIGLLSKQPFEPPQNAKEQLLADIWAKILHIDSSRISRYDSFFELGGDSLLAIQCACEAEDAGMYFSTNTVFTNHTIMALADVATDKKQQEMSISQAVLSGTFSLLPRQEKFFADNFAVAHHWNHHFHFTVDHHAEDAHLRAAFDTVLQRHDMMRARFIRHADGQWMQDISAHLSEETYYFSYNACHLVDSKQDMFIRNTLNHHHASLQLNASPLCRLVYIRTAHNAGVLAVIAHHLLLDMISARILFEDFLTSYEALRHNIPLPLPDKTSSIADIVTYYHQLADTHPDMQEARAYWQGNQYKQHNILKIANNLVGKDATAAREHIIFDADRTKALLQSRDYTVQDALLSAIHMALLPHIEQPTLRVNLCGHGRSDKQGLDTTRSVGWINSVFPIILEYEHSASLATHARHIRAARERVPAANDLYHYLRFTRQDAAFIAHQTPNIFFNYISHLDALLPEALSITPVAAPAGIISSSRENHLCYQLYFEAAVIEAQLHLFCTYSHEVIHSADIHTIMHTIQQGVTSLKL